MLRLGHSSKTTFVLTLLVGLSGTVITQSAEAKRGKWWIETKATVTGPFSVKAEFTTNISGHILLSANLALRSQKGDDIFIGTNFVKVPVKDGRGTVVIDGTKNPSPYGSTLPAGEYDLAVSFHPRWSENHAVASKLGIKETIERNTPLKLKASGGSAKAAKSQHDGQMWVMENVVMGMTWKPGVWTKKFGPWEKVQLERGNPQVLHMYYFKSIDMTLMVNVLKKEIVTWRTGLEHK